MKVYLLVCSELFEGNEDSKIIGIYSTYKNAENSIPPHNCDEFYEIVEETINETCYH